MIEILIDLYLLDISSDCIGENSFASIREKWEERERNEKKKKMRKLFLSIYLNLLTNFCALLPEDLFIFTSFICYCQLDRNNEIA